MYDTMTLTKTVASLCGALLLFLLIGWAGEAIYNGGHSADGEQAYAIDTGADEEATETAEAEVPFADVFAAADPAAGEGLFRQCQACHRLDGTDGTGPHLNGVVGRDIASVAGFSYSDALLGLEGPWDPEAISGFIEDPRGYASGTSMAYSGMRDVEDRANLIAYLATTGG